jgi:tyrosyl-tRNA synthetase
MVTQLIFWTESADHAVAITKLLFQDDNKMETLKTRNTKALEALHQATWWHTSKEPSLRVADLCTASGITSSNGEAKKAIKQWILYINEQKIDDVSYEISAKDSLEWLVLVRKGKKVWSSIRLPA